MNDVPFLSYEHFCRQFEQGILSLIEQPAVGSLILALCNSAVDENLLQKGAQNLRENFEKIAFDYRAALLSGRTPEGSPDDLLVFLKMLCVGFEVLQKSERRTAAGWELQFTPLRSFRPSRLAGETACSLFKPFDASGFHFNKPFLQRERLWEGALEGREVTLFYNKYPFARHHLLLVPERAAEQPQFLAAQHHEYVWRLAESIGQRIEGAVFAYNSYGAFASVNHLHFHSLICHQPLPVRQERWRHNGGERDYPAPCLAFASEKQAWEWIAECHAKERPYNLLYTPGRMYGFPRTLQGSVEPPAWSGGFAWYEMAGAFVVANRHDYLTLEGETIGAALRAAGCRAD